MVKDWSKVATILCDVADGKTDSFAVDLTKISLSFGKKRKLEFKQFLSQYANYCRTEFLMLDFVLFFESGAHSEAILNSTSNYSYNHIKNILRKIENHHAAIKGQEKYCCSFCLDIIGRCLSLHLRYAHTTDIFQKIFGLLIKFIQKHNCVVGRFSQIYAPRIYQCILVNHYYGNLDRKSRKIYQQNYLTWIKHQSGGERYKSPISIPIDLVDQRSDRGAQYYYRKDYFETSMKINAVLHDTVLAQFSHLCNEAVLHATKWKKLHSKNVNTKYSKNRFLQQTEAWIEKVCDFGLHYWQLFEKLIPDTKAPIVVTSMKDEIFNYNFFRCIFEAIFFDINSAEYKKYVHVGYSKYKHKQDMQIESSWRHSIWKLGFKVFQKKNMIDFTNSLHYLLRFCMETNQLQFEKNSAFQELFQLFSKNYHDDMSHAIESVRFPYGRNMDCYGIVKNSNGMESVPIFTSKMIRLQLMAPLYKLKNHGEVYVNITNCRDCMVQMSTLKEHWQFWIRHLYSFYGNSYNDEIQQDKYTRRLTYAVCNIWQDILNEYEYKYYLECDDVFVNYNLPNEIIELILDYKNSILSNEGDYHDDNEQEIWIDTYGKDFDYYPKILNLSIDEQNAHIKYVSKINKDVEQQWLDYFATKKCFQQIDKSTIHADNTQRNVRRIVGSIESTHPHFHSFLFDNVKSASYNVKNDEEKPKV